MSKYKAGDIVHVRLDERDADNLNHDTWISHADRIKKKGSWFPSIIIGIGAYLPLILHAWGVL